MFVVRGNRRVAPHLPAYMKVLVDPITQRAVKEENVIKWRDLHVPNIAVVENLNASYPNILPTY